MQSAAPLQQVCEKGSNTSSSYRYGTVPLISRPHRLYFICQMNRPFTSEVMLISNTGQPRRRLQSMPKNTVNLLDTRGDLFSLTKHQPKQFPGISLDHPVTLRLHNPQPTKVTTLQRTSSSVIVRIVQPNEPWN